MDRCRDCGNCGNAILLKGAYTGDMYLECLLAQEFARTATDEELEEVIKNPEKSPCMYIKGNPKYAGITYDD